MKEALLGSDEVIRILQYFRLTPTDSSPFFGIRGQTSNQPIDAIRDHGYLSSEWAKAFRLLCTPTRKVRSLVPGPKDTAYSVYFGDHEHLVGCVVYESRAKISFFFDDEHVIRHAEGVLGRESQSGADTWSTDLSPTGLIALALTLDAAREALFESLLARRGALDPNVPVSRIETQFEAGMKHEDARWLTTLVRLLMPPMAVMERYRLNEGLMELVSAGLLANEGGYVRLNDALRRLLFDWKYPLPAVAHESMTVGNGRLRRYRYSIAIRGDGSIRLVYFWRDPSDRVRATLLCAPGGRYGEILRGMLGSSRMRCTECGGSLGDNDRFCSQCGRPSGPSFPCDSVFIT